MKPTLKTLGMTAALGLVLAAGAATGGDAKSDDAKSDLARLKGTWVRELDGRTYVVNFTGEKFATIFEFAEGTTTTSGTITIDPTKKPQHMDWKFAAGTGRGEKLKGITALTTTSSTAIPSNSAQVRKRSDPSNFPTRRG
jgi:uncharacterized protein (TIGR03067 family)